MKTIKLPCYGITVTHEGTGGTITSDLHDDENVPRYLLAVFHIAIDTLEAFILAAVCAGVDIESPAFLKAIETTVDKIANKFGGKS